MVAQRWILATLVRVRWRCEAVWCTESVGRVVSSNGPSDLSRHLRALSGYGLGLHGGRAWTAAYAPCGDKVQRASHHYGPASCLSRPSLPRPTLHQADRGSAT